MADCNGQGSAGGPCDPPTIVPDSIRVAVAAGPLFRENDAAPLAACFVDQSSSLPLLADNKPSYPADRTGVESRSSMVRIPDQTIVLADAAKLDDDNNNPNVRTAEAPQDTVAGLDPLQLLPPPEEDVSPDFPPRPRPGSDQPLPSKQNTPGAVVSYSPAWQNLVREVGAAGAATATRPSLCACKKLAVAAMVSDEEGNGGATHRPGRVCANRGKETGCLYRAFNDAPIVPSTTVSNRTLSLLLHMDTRKSEAVVPTGREGGGKGMEGEAEGKRGGGPGGSNPAGIKEGGNGVKDQDGFINPGGVGDGKGRHLAQGATTSSLGKGEGAASSDDGNVVLVEIRRWLMDCVASVHCDDGALREAMARLVPPQLGQTHLSPGGGGQLIALHVAAVPLLVESLPTLPGVLKVEGSHKTAGIFTSAQAVPPTAVTPARGRPACSQQTGDRLPRQQHASSTGRPMAAPVPRRASEMVSPSMWDLASLGGCGSGSGINSGGGRGGAPAAAGVQAPAVAAAYTGSSGASGHAGGLGYSGTAPVSLLGAGGEGVGGTAAMMSAEPALFSTWAGADPQLLGWGNKAPGWPTAVASKSRDSCPGGGGAGGGGGGGSSGSSSSSIGGTWSDSVGRSGVAHGSSSDADIYRQGHHPKVPAAPSIVSSSRSSSSSGSSHACQYAEGAAAFKRQKTDSTVAPAGVSRPVGQHLLGYASLFSSDAVAPSGGTFGGALMAGAPHGASSRLGEPGLGGVGLADFAGDSFGTSEVDVESAWVDAVFDSESASSSSPFLLSDK